MSVLKLRRDQVVVEDEPAADEVVEIERPFPLRTLDHDTIEGELTELSDDDHHGDAEGKSFFQIVRFWINGIILLTAIAVYPVMTVLSSDVGDRDIASAVDRADWNAPWAGGASALMEKHFNELGWASDSPGWAPMARLTAKPAFQAAMAGSVGDFLKLENRQATTAGRADADLEAASRLVSTVSTGVQLRAARDALVNYDRRLRRRATPVVTTSSQLVEQLQLISSWAVTSQTEIAASSASMGGSPIDATATRAVYSAKGRAMAAFIFLDAMQWPGDAPVAAARAAALKAWEAAAEFHPLIVLNGTPDGSLFGNHAASMGFLIGQAQKATDAFLALATAASPIPAPAPVAISNVGAVR
jgi:hypothetical protein